MKQYQETWIRHSAHKHDINVEMFRFSEGIECYKEKNKQEKIEILKKNMLEIWNKNQKKFEENMQEEEKIDVSLENIESWIGRVTYSLQSLLQSQQKFSQYRQQDLWQENSRS